MAKKRATVAEGRHMDKVVRIGCIVCLLFLILLC